MRTCRLLLSANASRVAPAEARASRDAGMEKFTLTARARAIRIEPAEAERIIVRFPYSPEYVAKIRTVPGRRWHPDQKHWTVPHSDAALAHMLALFGDHIVDLDSALRSAQRRDGQAAQAALEIPDASPHVPGLL